MLKDVWGCFGSLANEGFVLDSQPMNLLPTEQPDLPTEEGMGEATYQQLCSNYREHHLCGKSWLLIHMSYHTSDSLNHMA